MNLNTESVYDETFYQRHTNNALDSARIILPLLTRLIQPKSVIDIGCGLGAWLKVFTEYGVERVRGVDGNHVDQNKLLIDTDCFTAFDLTAPLKTDDRYDLAVCLEVAEHLPKTAAPGLISALTEFAPFVLFSAAIPGQGGREHINEQWPSYWQALFAENGFRRLDPIRRHICRDSRVPSWYRQNIFLFGASSMISTSESLRKEEKLAELDLIYIDQLHRLSTLTGVLGELPRVFKEAITRRMRSLKRSTSKSLSISKRSLEL